MGVGGGLDLQVVKIDQSIAAAAFVLGGLHPKAPQQRRIPRTPTAQTTFLLVPRAEAPQAHEQRRSGSLQWRSNETIAASTLSIDHGDRRGKRKKGFLAEESVRADI